MCKLEKEVGRKKEERRNFEKRKNQEGNKDRKEGGKEEGRKGGRKEGWRDGKQGSVFERGHWLVSIWLILVGFFLTMLAWSSFA